MEREMRCLLLMLVLLGSSIHAFAGNLMVEVRTEGQSASDRQQIGVGVGGNAGWGVQGGRRTITRQETNTQRLLVMDGGTATLSSVQTQPLRLRQVVIGPYGKIISESYVFRSLGGGIRVTPRTRGIGGEMVDIEVGAEEARPVAGQYQATEVMQLSTQISGRVGEWIMIGDDQRGSGGVGSRAGGSIDSNNAEAGIAVGSGEASSGQRVWLRVMPAEN
jgi:hypothetical protein